jgi:hypothetical protein
MTSFDDSVTAGVTKRVNGLIDRHAETHADYAEIRCQVALAETYGVLTPDEVDRLELRLANLYEALHDQAAVLARISTELEFGNDG